MICFYGDGGGWGTVRGVEIFHAEIVMCGCAKQIWYGSTVRVRGLSVPSSDILLRLNRQSNHKIMSTPSFWYLVSD